MANSEITGIFFKIADILELQDVQWKPQAYRKAAQSISSLSKDVNDIYKKGGIKALEEIPGVGVGLAKKIIQFIEQGKINEYERLKKELPKGLEEIMQIPGMGPKRAKLLYKKLGITSVDELKKAAQEHKKKNIPPFKKKSEKNILKSIELGKKDQKKPLNLVLPIAEEIEKSIRQLKEVDQVVTAGSVRRKKDTVHDVDMLVTTKNPEKVADYFTKLPVVKRVLAKGKTRSSIITKQGIQVDLRVVEKARFGSALLYFTGSKEHNIGLRRIAIKKGYKLNEYGLFKGKKPVASKTEEEIYRKLGLKFIPPEKREA